MSEAVRIAAELCIHFEGFSSVPYKCPGGYWTQGYGTVYKPDGTMVAENDPPITKQIALQWLLSELKTNYCLGVMRASPNLIKHPEILGAITDFAYNLGVPRYRSSTLRKRLEEEDWEGAREELQKWVKAGGRVLKGLQLRRLAEAAYLP